MNGIFGITGTPGTGKKSVAPLVAKMLRVNCIGLNDLAKSEGVLKAKGKEGEVDTEQLKKTLSRHFGSPAVVYGHLLPYAIERRNVNCVVVLRCEPSVLKLRLASRGYPHQKVVDNVQAELIGLIATDAVRAFGRSKTFEFDTTNAEPKGAANEIASVLRGVSRSDGPIEWMANYDSGAKLRSLLSQD